MSINPQNFLLTSLSRLHLYSKINCKELILINRWVNAIRYKNTPTVIKFQILIYTAFFFLILRQSEHDKIYSGWRERWDWEWKIELQISCLIQLVEHVLDIDKCLKTWEWVANGFLMGRNKNRTMKNLTKY